MSCSDVPNSGFWNKTGTPGWSKSIYAYNELFRGAGMAAGRMDLADVIESLISQIEIIRDELSVQEADPETGLAISKAPIDSVRRLKTAVDHFRLFLWAYVDSHPDESNDTNSRLRHLRMERAAEMLGQLSSDFRSSGVPGTEDAARLREEIRAIEPMILRNRPLRPSGTDR